MRVMSAVSAALFMACAGSQSESTTASGAVAGDTLSVVTETNAISGTFQRSSGAVTFQTSEVSSGVYEVEVVLADQGLTLTALVEPGEGVSTLDGFATDTGDDTQILDADRTLLAGLYAALNDQLPHGDEASSAAKYLRRAVGVWVEHPTTLALSRVVMGEESRGYTSLCSYAKCNGSYTGSCNGSYNWYSYSKHDCQHGSSSYEYNQQIAQLGDHTTCDGDEYYLSGSTWLCGEPDHWYRPKVMGNCFGRVGSGCGGDTQYTVDAANHDGCVRNGHALASAYCDDEFLAAVDDALFAPNCY